MENLNNDLVDKIKELKPILESFHIYGLHGVKDIKYDAANAASILMAKNGAGKTTFLSSVNSVLTRRFYKLNDLTFRLIRLKLSGGDFLEISRKDIDELMDFVKSSKISEFSKETGVTLDKIMVAAEISSSQASLNRTVGTNVEFDEVYRRHPTMTARQMYQELSEFSKSLNDHLPNIKNINNEIQRALDGVEVVYLPTYRRIEVSLPQQTSPNSQYELRRRRAANSIPEDVKFGLSDISDRLREISTEVQRTSSTTYKRISANIVNDLLDGTYKLEINQGTRPERKELELFFNRLRGAQRFNQPSVTESEVIIPDVDSIYNDKIDEDARPFLLYFLSNLNTAMQSTKPLEDRVSGFVAACNEYLNDEDSSAYVKGSVGPFNPDAKSININKDDFRPYFTASGGEKRVPIEALSSGEKQVVSLFARLYLYPKRKIILYDEPELSLSMAWQAKLLPDVCQSSEFSQLIAITHSPFVFDNELDEFAANLLVSTSNETDPILEEAEFDIEQFFAEIGDPDISEDE